MDEIKSISWVLGLFYSEKKNKTIYLVVYSFFVKVVFVLRFLFNFLRESRKNNTEDDDDDDNDNSDFVNVSRRIAKENSSAKIIAKIQMVQFKID